MKLNLFFTLTTVQLVFLHSPLFAQVYGITMGDDVVVEIKNQITGQIKELSPEQQLLIEAIFDEHRKEISIGKGGIKMDQLYQLIEKEERYSAESDHLVSDILNADQFEQYKLIVKAVTNRVVENSGDTIHQSIHLTGKIFSDKDGSPLQGATIVFRNIRDSALSRFGVTDARGYYSVKGLDNAFHQVTITRLGYKPFERMLRILGSYDLGSVSLEEDALLLQDVAIEGEHIPVEQRGDTISYNAKAFAVESNASAAELVNQIPGLSASKEGVSANGKKVEQVLLDGRRFFGQQTFQALNAVPAEIVERVELYDEQSDRAQFTGVEDGNSRFTMNLITNEGGQNAMFGEVAGGYGSDDRYIGQFNLTKRSETSSLMLLGNKNNINTDQFERTPVFNFIDGILAYDIYMINYSYDSKKISFSIDNFLDYKRQQGASTVYQETFQEGGDLIYEEKNTSNENTLSFLSVSKLDYRPDEKHSLIFTPTITLSNSEANETNEVTITQSQLERVASFSNQDKGNSLGIEGNLLYQQKLNSRGTNFAIETNSNFSNTSQNNDLSFFESDSTISLDDHGDSRSLIVTSTFSEPLGIGKQLELSHEFETSSSKDMRDASERIRDLNEQINTGLSYDFRGNFKIHRSKVFFQKTGNNQLNLQLMHQVSNVSGDQFAPFEDATNKTFHALLPSLTWESTGVKNKWSLNVKVKNRLPSPDQLREGIDYSNPIALKGGNSSLHQSLTPSIRVGYEKNVADKFLNFRLTLNARRTIDYITTAIFTASEDSILRDDVVMTSGAQIAYPVNISGRWSSDVDTYFSRNIKKLNTNFRIGLSGTYGHTPGLVNNVENTSKVLTLSSFGSLKYWGNEKLEIRSTFRRKASRIENSINPNTTSYRLDELNIDCTYRPIEKYFVESVLQNKRYSGVSQEVNTSFWAWNVSIGRKFMNGGGDIVFTVYDLLQQVESVSQSVSALTFRETRSILLDQYFMIKVSYRFENY